ncbi:hypothetical protein [Paraburkholderia atlantica]|uniref:Uncharacterized protein n=1 Tax=Paraburkholderia atlantica TaxID=2654982 RepID=D5WNJ4_PARAM|nr:hypothetical protein [Paraburkholderia atlantica]ADG20873.1 conserved hypothetical protein [Paraburkholderia atlantica]MBB5511058.1 hypothetical protein [Paraburkholderia atlantica]
MEMQLLPYNLDDEARTELLGYLVVVQLIARARTGQWLEAAHVCESVLLWLSANGGNCGARERSDLSRLSVDVAEQFLGLPPFDDEASLVQMILALSRLDYRKSDVKKILAFCGKYITHRHGAGQS